MKRICFTLLLCFLMSACGQPKPQPLVVATVSMNAKTDTTANLKTFENYMTDAASQGAQLIVFPEISLQQNPGWGFSDYYPTQEEVDYVKKTAETIPGESTDILTKKAKELGIYVIFGMTERGDDGNIYNTSVFLGPEGVLASYRKSILWDVSTGGNEHLFWTPGTEYGKVVESPLGKIGMMICIEMGVYEYGIVFGKEGVDLMVVVSAWPDAAGDLYEEITKKYPGDCDCWMVVANQVGIVGHSTDYGHSRIIDPNGEVRIDTGYEEGLKIVETGLFVEPRR